MEGERVADGKRHKSENHFDLIYSHWSSLCPPEVPSSQSGGFLSLYLVPNTLRVVTIWRSSWKLYYLWANKRQDESNLWAPPWKTTSFIFLSTHLMRWLVIQSVGQTKTHLSNSGRRYEWAGGLNEVKGKWSSWKGMMTGPIDDDDIPRWTMSWINGPFQFNSQPHAHSCPTEILIGHKLVLSIFIFLSLAAQFTRRFTLFSVLNVRPFCVSFPSAVSLRLWVISPITWIEITENQPSTTPRCELKLEGIVWLTFPFQRFLRCRRCCSAVCLLILLLSPVAVAGCRVLDGIIIKQKRRRRRIVQSTSLVNGQHGSFAGNPFKGAKHGS